MVLTQKEILSNGNTRFWAVCGSVEIWMIVDANANPVDSTFKPESAPHARMLNKIRKNIANEAAKG